MTQVFTRSSVLCEQDTDAIPAFANRHRLKWRLDEDGTRFIPGKCGQIYEYGSGLLAVMVMPSSPRKNLWGRTRNRLEKLGFVAIQDGDYEGAATFEPADQNRSKAAIKAAGISRKRQLSPAQINRQFKWLRGPAGGAL